MSVCARAFVCLLVCMLVRAGVCAWFMYRRCLPSAFQQSHHRAPSSWPLESVEITHVSAYASDAQLPVARAVDMQNYATSGGNTPYSWTAEFDLYLLANTFPEVTQTDSAFYTFTAHAEVSYIDGSTRRSGSAGLRAAGTTPLQPSLKLLVVPLAGVGDLDDGGNMDAAGGSDDVGFVVRTAVLWAGICLGIAGLLGAGVAVARRRQARAGVVELGSGEFGKVAGSEYYEYYTTEGEGSADGVPEVESGGGMVPTFFASDEILLVTEVADEGSLNSDISEYYQSSAGGSTADSAGDHTSDASLSSTETAESSVDDVTYETSAEATTSAAETTASVSDEASSRGSARSNVVAPSGDEAVPSFDMFTLADI